MRGWLLLPWLASRAAVHGMMTDPPTRFRNAGPAFADLSLEGSVFWFNQGPSPGCLQPTGLLCTNFTKRGASACCAEPMEPTLNSASADTLSPRTFSDAPQPGGAPPLDAYRYTPWRAPGYAPVADPCGLAGGSLHDLPPSKGGVAPPGY